ncbi:MAG: B12-binding domain-containing radical SAM protein [Candidatus Avigastranaerophilus sp.]
MARPKVILTIPNHPTYFVTPPLGIGYLSSCLKEKNINSIIIDAVRLELNEEELIKQIDKQSPDWICISCLSAYFDKVKSLSLKLKNKNYKVIIGGVHPTFMPYMTLVETKCDYVIAGEGEIALPELILKGDNTEIKGVYSIRELKNENTSFDKAQMHTDLDNIPFPDWEQINPKTYPPAPMGMVAKNYPIAPVIASRGCAHACTYCAGNQLNERKVRFRSPENVIKEIKLLVEKYGVKEFQFIDANIILRRNFIEQICNLLIKEKLNKIPWSCPSGIRADCFDFELAKLMKKAGCYMTVIGIESANPQILKTIKKGETIETITEAIENAHKAGIITVGAFMLGLPGDTKETMRETIDYAKKVPLDRAVFSMLDILPGCEIWQNNKEKYKMFQQETSFAKPSVIPEGMTEEELVRIQDEATYEFYFRPRIMFNIIKFIRFSQLKYLIRRLNKFSLIKNLFTKNSD